MNKSSILELLINHYSHGNKAKFAKMIGVRPQTINTWMSRNSFDMELVYSKCKSISGDWLLNGGEGEMLQKQNNNILSNEHSNIVPCSIVNHIHIGEKISQLLKEKQISKADLARRIGMPPQNINRMLTRESIETIKLLKISEAIGYNLFTYFIPPQKDVTLSILNSAKTSYSTALDSNCSSKKSTTNCNSRENRNGEFDSTTLVLSKSIEALTRELETCQAQKGQLIKIIDKLTNH
jgi:hypothetical protein